MELKKHYLMTVAALFFLGVVMAKPGATFFPVKDQRECKLVKGKINCSNKFQENKVISTSFWYKYE